jgi:hypothetical protein
MAMRRALVLSTDHGFKHVVFASDCLTVIQKISSLAKDRSMVGSVVGDIKTLANEFSVCSFKHVGRKVNVVAHCLARSSELSFVIFILMLLRSAFGRYYVMMLIK